jgi:legumain
MLGKFNALCALAATVSATPSDHWAVIVAGSTGFSNYRHQSDVCHAYQLLKSRGIPENQIIHINHDDVANSISNPFRG